MRTRVWAMIGNTLAAIRLGAKLPLRAKISKAGGGEELPIITYHALITDASKLSVLQNCLVY